MLIRYVCECCDRLVEEILVDENLVNLLSEDQVDLTGLNPADIINLETRGSLVLETMCPQCLAEIRFEDGGSLALIPPILN